MKESLELAEKRPPQVKVCGLRHPAVALACAQNGANAIGLVFYPRSPRRVAKAQAATIARAVANLAVPVGIFVDASYDVIMHTVEPCRIPAVQLHGGETPDLTARLCRQGLLVIKTLFLSRPPGFDSASEYRVSAFLIEDGGGRLPGGNARTWHWQHAAGLDRRKPILLAGGLDRFNVGAAIAAVRPDAVDVSSGVEIAPGVKSPAQVKHFATTVRQTANSFPIRRIFDEPLPKAGSAGSLRALRRPLCGRNSDAGNP
jgi:phosphoribosylanthranilate isomerase